MIRNYLVASFALLFCCITVAAQTGSIQGKIVDKITKEPIPFANIAAYKGGSLIGGAQTDFDGKYSIKPLDPGSYDVKATIVGYGTKEVTNVLVSVDKITFLDLDLSKGVDIKEVEVTGYKVPLIEKDNASTKSTITQEDIRVAPTRDVKGVVSTAAGVYQRDEGGALNIRGSRDNATDYYIDGIKVRGSTNLPQAGIEQVTVVTGGLPAQYGDATGGVISITTRGPSKKFFGGVEFVTSELFDDYGHNLAGFDVSGPVLTRRDKEGKKTGDPMVGFFIAGEYQYDKDPSPSAIGAYVVKEDILKDMEQTPFILSPTGSGFIQRGNFLRLDSLEHVKARPNVASSSYRLSGKIDIQPVKNVTLSLGGSYDYNKRHDFIDIYAINDYVNNNQVTDNTWRVFGKLTQKFSSGNESAEEKKASTIKNAFYSLQFDYSKVTSVSEDDSHEDNYFRYGYLGNFTTYRRRAYDYDFTLNAWKMVGYTDTLVTFQPDPAEANPVLVNYTNQYLTFVPDPVSVYQIQQEGGMINGDNRINLNIYSLWASPGRQFNGYGKSEANQFRVTASGSADIKDHSIVIGFEYEQRIDRAYNVAPSNLWQLMRQLGNFNIQNLDTANPHPVYDEFGIFQDTINFDYLYVQNQINNTNVEGFYENFRRKVGVSNTTWVDIDSYPADIFSLDLFTPDELLLNGPFVSYYGYDYLGNKTSDNPSLNDFFSKKKDGNYTREIGAFQPVYTAGYIQDKFAFQDLIFNIGLRVDRYDANQKVLKDKYLLYAAKTKGEVPGSYNPVVGEHPGNIGDDYVVYVNDFNTPTPNILGYRNGDDWYDAQGNLINDPSVITSTGTTGGQIRPYLISPNDVVNKVVNTDAVFKDFDPQISYMPRIAFSFPISDEAMFFAHYDLLTQRPPGRNRLYPVAYLPAFFGATVNNPDLKPEKTIDYELGFKQVLSKSSALSISGFYREMRDMIQIINVNYAFPINYSTFGNIDIGTVKGLSLSYDLRRTGNVRLTASYTLQFAEGTGSSDVANATLIGNGQPNLREIKPLSFDQRHSVVTSVDYRYGGGNDYNGPMLFGKPILARTGLNVVFRAGSGTPYSRQANITQGDAVTQNVAIGISQRSTLDGNINGSRLPWQFRIDARIDRDFEIKFGKTKDDGSRKRAFINVYLQVQNLLDARNVIAVYRFTGNPDDDGYLNAAASQNDINSKIDQQAFRDLYSIKVNNPGNYSLPRRINLGVKIDL
ncbi:MAG TPA: TonB-dependent receptor [Bacteroidia bacterium]|nr:TonB-dependent receptor [Bacteroidia bacterium]